jgi:hypothetical protein
MDAFNPMNVMITLYYIISIRFCKQKMYYPKTATRKRVVFYTIVTPGPQLHVNYNATASSQQCRWLVPLFQNNKAKNRHPHADQLLMQMQERKIQKKKKSPRLAASFPRHTDTVQ